MAFPSLDDMVLAAVQMAGIGSSPSKKGIEKGL